MPVVAEKLFDPAQVAASATTYYTVPALTRTRVSKLTAVNTTGTARTLSVYFVPSGGSAGVTNQIIVARTIPINSEVELFECANHVLEASDSIQAVASAATAITLHGSGVEFR